MHAIYNTEKIQRILCKTNWFSNCYELVFPFLRKIMRKES